MKKIYRWLSCYVKTRCISLSNYRSLKKFESKRISKIILISIASNAVHYDLFIRVNTMICDQRANDEYNFIVVQCNCSLRSILAIAPNIAMVSRAIEDKRPQWKWGKREREKEKDKNKDLKKRLWYLSCICYSMLKKLINCYFKQCIIVR